jgi:hypothetical protein
MGQIALNYWSEIPHHFPYAKLGGFIVMPNHVCGIIIIDKSNDVIGGRDVINRVRTNTTFR